MIGCVVDDMFIMQNGSDIHVYTKNTEISRLGHSYFKSSSPGRLYDCKVDESDIKLLWDVVDKRSKLDESLEQIYIITEFDGRVIREYMKNIFND